MIAATAVLTAALLGALPAPPPTAPAPDFAPEATLRALGHPEGRATALRQLLALPRPLRAVAVDALSGALPQALSGLAADATATPGHRIAAVESLAVLAAEPCIAALAARLAVLETPEDTAVARAAAIALRGLRAPAARAALASAVDSNDPEVRATVAAAAVAPEALCAALADPWPVVRAAAAQGLGRLGEPERGACLVAALRDGQPGVRSAAVRAVGLADVKTAVPDLRALAGDAAGPVPLRADAIEALGRLGDLEPARKVLETHIQKGGIVPLAVGAIAALSAATTTDGAPANQSRDLLRAALASEAPSVVVAAASALARQGDVDAVSALEAARSRLDARHREALDAALSRLRPAAAPDLETPAADDASDPAMGDPE